MRALNPISLVFWIALTATNSAVAGRSLIAPQFFWHDWYLLTPPNPSGTPPGGGLQRCVDISVTNLSSIPGQIQTVTVTATTVNALFSTGSMGNPGSSLAMEVNGPSNVPSPVKNPGSRITLSTGPVPIGPKATAVSSFCGIYNRVPQTCLPGDWHLMGAFDLEFTVDEDRGAVAAVLNSRMENTGCPFDMNNGVSALRNTSKTILINGARPF